MFLRVRPAIGYETRYTVREDGTVFCRSTLEPLKPRNQNSGYLQVNLWDGHSHKNVLLHRLVLATFTEGYRDLQVNHIDGNKLNCSLDNLEWVTQGENMKHRYQVLGIEHPMKGRFHDKHPKAKPIESYDIQTGKTLKSYASATLAELDGFNRAKICECVKGLRAHHRNLGWRYSFPLRPTDPGT